MKQTVKLPRPARTPRPRQPRSSRHFFGDEYANAKTPADKKALAKKLIAKADKTTDDLAGKFVLLRLAKDIAAQASDGLTAYQAIDAMAESYQVDALEMKTAVLVKFTALAKTTAERASIAEQALKLMDQAARRDSFTISGQLGEVALGEARKVADKELLATAQGRIAEAAALANAYDEVKAARVLLEKMPDDPQANEVVGKYLCLVKEDWDKGLPFMALGKDEALKALAAKELAGAAASSEQAKLGDGWWNLAEKEQAPAKKKKMLDRAAHWYRQALPGLSGLRKDEAEKRIASSRSLTSRKLVDAVAEFTWKAEAAKPRRMIQRQTGFCVLSSVSGHFMGSGELVGFYIRKDGYWYLEGKSGQAQLGVSAMSLTVRSPSWMLYDFRLFAWRQGEKPVKVIHKDEGFCVLASVGGHFAGIGEQVRVYVDEHDGYWYLGGESHQKDVQATAISVRFARPRSAAIATYRWKRGDDPVQMLKKDEGLCFLSAVSGDFRGYGESVRIGIEKDDYWYLKGSAGNELRAEATSIRIP